MEKMGEKNLDSKKNGNEKREGDWFPKPDGPGLIPSTHVVEGENQLL